MHYIAIRYGVQLPKMKDMNVMTFGYNELSKAEKYATQITTCSSCTVHIYGIDPQTKESKFIKEFKSTHNRSVKRFA